MKAMKIPRGYVDEVIDRNIRCDIEGSVESAIAFLSTLPLDADILVETETDPYSSYTSVSIVVTQRRPETDEELAIRQAHYDEHQRKYDAEKMANYLKLKAELGL